MRYQDHDLPYEIENVTRLRPTTTSGRLANSIGLSAQCDPRAARSGQVGWHSRAWVWPPAETSLVLVNSGHAASRLPERELHRRRKADGELLFADGGWLGVAQV